MKTFTFLAAICFFALWSFKSNDLISIDKFDKADIANFSVNPPTGKTGAPGEGTCTDCHSGSVLDGDGIVTFGFDGADSEYVPGQVYNLSISSALANGKNGFQLTILNSSNLKAGNFQAGTHSATTLVGGKQYIRQSTSTGVSSWQFQWTAPATEMGDLTAYYAYNKTNGSSTTAGDVVYVSMSSILSSFVSVHDIDEDPYKISTIFDASSRLLHINYNLKANKKVVVNVQSLNGQLIQSTTIGIQEPGNYHKQLSVNPLSSGIYIVSVFVDNQVFSSKLLLQ